MGLGAYEADVYHESVKREVHTIRKNSEKSVEKESFTARGEQNWASHQSPSPDTQKPEKAHSSTPSHKKTSP